ncbi:hypothetical protein [Undibacterium flavidum]|uniref:WD40 repeat protein n=1 Tax=Undibacterium flavidum TaxID=2762297 RepID=A0ABR6YBU9_9BURK|nr:hypothetical protein [Undibacterium flavidum]MBC3874043.1 hypothetical protein [Undibacterium flavidum]
MRQINFLFIFAILITGNACAATEKRKVCDFLWSENAKNLERDVDKPNEAKNIYSQDRKSSVKISRDGIFFVSNGKATHLKEIEFYPYYNEVLWAEDSKRFVITSSDGGLSGGWHVYVYEIDENSKLKRLKLPNKAVKIIDKLPNCDGGYSTNVGAIKWENEGKNLVIGLVVPHNGVCKNAGWTLGMKVSFDPSEIVEKYSKKELLRRFSDSTGCELK